MEQRLIDANELLEKRFNTGYEYGEINVVGTTHIENAPTIDAVSIVRCGECKHYWKTGLCLYHDRTVHHKSDFCNYGEKFEKEGINGK